MWDSLADHKHNTVLLFFEDAIDPLGNCWVGLLPNICGPPCSGGSMNVHSTCPAHFGHEF